VKDFSQMTDDELDNAIIQQSAAQPQEMDLSNLSDDQLDEMIIKKEIDNTPQDRPVEAFTRSFGNAASFGYLPQIEAATEPFIQGAVDFFSGDNTDDKLKEQGFSFKEAPKDSYVQRRDRSIGELNQLNEENPLSSMSGGASGAIVNGIATGGGLTKLIGSAGKAATLGQRFGQAAKTGAAVGAIRNPSDTEGEVSPLQLKERVQNSAQDAATGAVIQGGLEVVKKVGEGVKGASKNIKTWSQNKALKSVGYMKKDFEKAFGKKKTAEIGQAIIDEKISGLGDDITDISKNSEAALKSSGKRIGQIYDKADDITSLSQGDVSGLNNDFIEESAKRLDGTIDGKAVASKMEDVLEVLRDNKNPTFGQLRKLRSSIDDKINFAKESKDLPLYQEELLHLRNKIQDLVKGKIGSVNPELSKSLVSENRKFSQFSDISKISRKKMAGENSNAAFGLRERISGGVGATIGGMIGGIPGAAAGAVLGTINTKLARQYGTPFVAMTANKVARALEKNSNAIGKFSQPLIDSAKNPEKFVASINMLMKDPEFKKSVNEMDKMPIYRGPAKGKVSP
jgi:hypothetical protein